MKKNISINISGIIFHIEEDGYDKLKNYLDSITRYFSNFDDTGEITSDIESRIAEIFLTKLNEGKQVITQEDVDELIQTMGSIQDFQAVGPEEEEVVIEKEVRIELDSPDEDEQGEETKGSTKESFQSTGGKRKLYRDTKRRLVGGVAAGIANYFSLDPLWIRLLFVLFALDIFVTQSLSALTILGYIILWIALPGNDSLEESKNVKKLYRNPDDKVLGGVAGGIAAYFGTDSTIIRLIFVLSIFLGGAGFIIYLILWIIVPEAKSITEKVQMKGEPVTLENIETNIKKGLNVKPDEEEESPIVRVLLFPFRLLARLISWLSKALGPILAFLVDVLRVLVGVILIIIGISTVMALFITLGVVLGVVTSGAYSQYVDFPYQLFTEAIPVSGVIAGFFASFIPSVAILLLGVMVITKSRVIKASVGWTLLAIWIISIGMLAFIIPGVVYDFRSEGEYRETITYELDDATLYLYMNTIDKKAFDSPELDIRGHEGPKVKLVKEYTAYGNSRRDAIDNAQLVKYTVEVEDSVMTFDSDLTYEKGDLYRFQSLRMVLYIPYGQEFVMDREMRDILRYYSLSRHGYYYSQLGDNRWIFNESGLECLTCDTDREVSERRQRELRDTYNDIFKIRGYYEEFDVEEFDRLRINDAFTINIVQNDEYKVIVNGPRHVVESISLVQEDDEVIFDVERSGNTPSGRDRRNTKIIIGMPSLHFIELSEAATGFVKGFEEDRFRVRLNGASEIEMDIDVTDIEISLGGASKLNLTGKGEEMSVDLSAASILDAYDFKVENCEIEAAVASSAKVYVTENLDIRSSMATDIKYRGGARVRRR